MSHDHRVLGDKQGLSLLPVGISDSIEQRVTQERIRRSVASSYFQYDESILRECGHLMFFTDTNPNLNFSVSDCKQYSYKLWELASTGAGALHPREEGWFSQPPSPTEFPYTGASSDDEEEEEEDEEYDEEDEEEDEVQEEGFREQESSVDKRRLFILFPSKYWV